ncbi:MAG: hypothetical protein KDB14_16680 [Planctomycetales bacterium]|nr:hypothetical protein [Planctomycetales bacterium]
MNVLETLRQQLAQREDRRCSSVDLLSSGTEPLDRLLPRGGFLPGTLIEWLAPTPSAVGTLALLSAREAMARRGGYVVVFDRARNFYPPAAAAWGIDLQRLLVVQPANHRDELWAIDQALRCEAVAAVWAPLAHLESKLDSHCLRRWQLAAEQSGALGLLLRPASARQLPCWSDAQVQVRPHAQRGPDEHWRLHIELLKVRGGNAGGSAELEIHASSLGSSLASSLGSLGPS